MTQSEPVGAAKLTYELIDPEEQIASEEFRVVEHFLRATRRLEIGWHYITDIVWIYRKIKQWPRGWTILDAGGGRGPLQFFLAELGFSVTNVDMVFPAAPWPVFVDRYRLHSRRLERSVETEYAEHVRSSYGDASGFALQGMYRKLRDRLYRFRHDRWRDRAGLAGKPIGRIEWLAGNLCDLGEIAPASFDAVVSLSALEHIPLEQVAHAWREIERVLKPSAPCAVTTSASATHETWLHGPSLGWCFSPSDLHARFGAVPARQQDPSQVLERYLHCCYLKTHLARFYHSGGNNGMPWGEWRPQYVPVGLSR